MGKASLNECRSIKNDTPSGDFTIYLGLEEERGMSQPRSISDKLSTNLFQNLTAFVNTQGSVYCHYISRELFHVAVVRVI